MSYIISLPGETTIYTGPGEKLIEIGPSPEPKCKHERTDEQGEILCAHDGEKCFPAKIREATVCALVSDCDQFELNNDEPEQIDPIKELNRIEQKMELLTTKIAWVVGDTIHDQLYEIKRQLAEIDNDLTALCERI